MADSSPGLQISASNFHADAAPTPEAISTANQFGSKDASARLASEWLSGQNPAKDSDAAGGLARATKVLAGGLADGVVDSAKNSLNWHTGASVAESLVIGYGLGALTKAGPVGQKLAMAGGLYLGAKWIYGELEAGRPQATINAVADAYRNADHAAQDRQIVASTGGAMAFETGLAMIAGGVGMKKGLELKTNWQVDALASVKSNYGMATDFLARDGRVNSTQFLNDRGMGLAFAGKDTAAGTPMALAKEIIAGKTKSGTSLADIQETFKRGEITRNDANLLEIREKLSDLDREHAQIRTEEAALGPKLSAATKDLATAENLAPFEQTVRLREQQKADAEQAKRDIPGKKDAHDTAFAAQQKAFEAQRPKPGEPVDQALQQDFQSKRQAFQQAKTEFTQAQTLGSEGNLARSRQSLAEAQTALAEARRTQPDQIAAAQAQIDSVNEQLGALKIRRQAVEDQVKPLVDKYNGRLTEVMEDPTKLVQAKFDPPPPRETVAKPATGKKGGGADPIATVKSEPGPVSATDEVLASSAAHDAGTAATIRTGATGDGAHTASPGAAVIEPARVEVTHADNGVNAGAAAGVIDMRPPVVEPQVAAGGNAHDLAETGTANRAAVLERKTGETTETPVKEKAAEQVEPKGVELLSRDAQSARETALKSVRSNELVREREYATRVLDDITRGTYKPARGASIGDVRVEMERRVTDINEQLGNDPGIKYTRALKSVMTYSRSIAKQLAETADSGMRDKITVQALTDIEGMMGRLPTSYKGYPGKLADLAEPSRGGRLGSPEKRFADVSDHLEAKAAMLDNSKARQDMDMAERQPILNEVMTRLKTSNLPDDASIILIGKDGKYLGPPGGTSPYFIEVSRMKAQGVGANGGGFNRFHGIQNDIAGAVILRPIYENGKPVELPGRSSGGKPVYKKIVEETIGTVPEGITKNLNFVDILRRFAPPRS